MTPAEVDATLARFGAAIDAMTANLLELDANPTNKLLDPATMTGVTKERASAARETFTSLWEHFTELKDLVEQARTLRGTGHVATTRLAELESLLRGPSITLPPIDVPLATRGLYSPSQTPMATTPDDLLANMGAAFEFAKGVVLAVDEAWRTLVPRVGALQTELADLERTAAALGEERGVLDKTRTRVDGLSQRIANDPLSVAPEEFSGLDASVSTERVRLEALSHDRDALDADLRAAASTLDDISAAIDEGAAALAEARLKIFEPAGLLAVLDRGCLSDPERGLTHWLERLGRLAHKGDWRSACRGIDQWQRVAADTLAAARSVAAANAAPVRYRNELRGRLDALAAKAERLGLTEDADLSALHEQVRALLYTAPTDLSVAGTLVARYGAALTGPTAEPAPKP